MNKNEIEGIKPFNKFHYKNCFYSAFFSVVEHFNKKILNILSNDVLLYTKEEKEDISVKYLEAKEISSIISSMGIGGELKSKCEDVISDIKVALCKNRPAILWIDCYYQSARKEMYLKKHWRHAMLIYGFNDDKKEFKAIEQVGNENSSYDKLNVSYNDIINCYNSYMKRFYSDDMPVLYEFFLNDLQKNEMTENNLDSSFVSFKEHFNNNIDMIEKGIEVLSVFIKNYKEKASDREKFSQKCGEWIKFVNDVINSKRVEKYKILNFFGEKSELFLEYTQLIKYWENIRIVLGKYIFTLKYNEKSVEKSMKIFDLIAIQEKKCFQIMKEILCIQEGKYYIKSKLTKLILNENNEFLEKQNEEKITNNFIEELKEIENALLSIDGIVEATVIEQENDLEERSLCAYLVTSNSINEKELGVELSKKLPKYMIPSNFIKLDKSPSNNKSALDEEKILEFNRGVTAQTEYVAAKNEIEEKLVKLWSEVLEISKVGIDDNFFELGGDSLKTIQIVAMIQKELNVEISIGEAFTNPTIRELSKCIEVCNDRMYFSIEPAEKADSYKVTSAQKRLFILNQMDTDSLAYNMPLMLLIEGELQKEKLKKIFPNLVERHEALRTSFKLKNGEIVQIINERVKFEIEYIKTKEENSKEVINDFVRTFDLGIAPLFRVGIIEIHSKKYILMLDMHHIISDGTSMRILTNEFVQLYQEKALPELKIQYKDYAVWQNEEENVERIKMQEKYWCNRLGKGIPHLNMPLDYERKEMQTFIGKTIYKKIERDLVQKMSLLAQRTNTTMNIILMSFYSILLSKYCKQKDVIVGITVSNRNHQDLKDVIGAFINFLPIKSTVNEDMSISKFIEEEKKIMKDAYDNQEYPFDEITEKFVKKLDKTRNPIFDTMLIYHNEIEVNTDVEIDRLKFKQINFENKTSKLDFKLDIILNSENGLDCYLEYNTNIYEEKSMLQLLNHFELLMNKASNDIQLNVSDIDIFDEEEKIILRQKQKINNENKSNLTIAISATFTCDPIEEYLQWWCHQYGKEVEVKIAPYNQIFQQMLSCDSIISKNKGINLLLIRFEDWIRDIKASDEEKCSIIRNNYEKLLETIKNINKSAVNIIGIFPISEKLGLSNTVVSYIENLNRKWKAIIHEIENLELIDFNEGIELYNIKEIFDPIKNRAGHMPFSDEYYGAIGTMVARKVCSLYSNCFKVIAVDCDNTLWRGICGEDGALGVNIDKPYMELQKLLIKKQNEGMIIVLCSKNNEDDVWDVFENNPNMLLRKEHLAGWKINWNSKCENLKDLAKELNLGIDSFIFIEDSHIECYDMMKNNPEVLTLQLPENPMNIPKYLKHIWAFDKTKVTKEDKVRTKQYQQERQRKEIQNSNYNLKDFLKELELKIYINEIEKNEIDRVAQLTQRTNQFNLSTIRRTEKEIEEILNNPDMKCWTIKVEDRFGQYGLTGTIIMKRQEDCLFLDTFLLSCRVLGRNVEEAVLLELCKFCKENGFEKIEANFYPTLKNRMIEEYLLKSGWYKVNENDEFVKYELYVEENCNSIDFIECYYGKQNEVEKEEGVIEKFQCTLDHIGVAVKDIKTAGEYYSTINYLKSKTIYDPLQDAHLVLCSKEEYDTIELITMNNNEVLSYMSSNIDGGTPYHLCYRVQDFQDVIKNLNDYKIQWELVKDSTTAVLFGGKEVLFMYIKGIGLIEFLQDPVYEYKDVFQKLNTIRILVTDKENSIKFFEMLGYCETDRIYDTVNKILSIQLSRKGSGNIELLIGRTNNLMLSATKLHIQEICYRSNDKKNMIQLLESKGYQYSDVLENHRYGSLSEVNSIIQFKDMKYNLYYFTEDNNQDLIEPEWKVNIYDEKTFLHKNFILPLNYHTGKLLLKLPIYENKQNIQISGEYVAPRNEIEERLVKIWSKVLDVNRIGIDDNFFTLGGHSLKAIQFTSLMHKELNVEITLGDFLKRPTIKQLSEYICQAEKSKYCDLEKAEERDYYPLSPTQLTFFLINENKEERENTSVPLIMRIKGEVSINRLEEAFRGLIARHEAFRTSIEIVDDQPIFKIHNDVEFNIEYKEASEDELNKSLNEYIQHFDLAKPPLMRVCLIKTGENQYVLFIVIHHIVMDGYSVNIIQRELLNLYQGTELAEKKYDYRDYLVHHMKLLKPGMMEKRKEYWFKQFDDGIPVLDIPIDMNESENQVYNGQSVEMKFSTEYTKKLIKLANEKNTTLHMLIFSLYAILLNKYSSQNDIVIGSISAGRDLAECENIIGAFINIIPLRVKVDEKDSFLDFLNKAKDLFIKGYENQYFSFDIIKEKKIINNELPTGALFNTLVNFHTEIEKNRNLVLNDLIFEPYNEFNYREADLDIQLDVVIEDSEELQFIFEYNANKFKRESIERMVKCFSSITNQVLADSTIQLSRLSMLSESERNHLLFDFNNTYKKYDYSRTFVDLFEEQVELTPDKIAVRCDEEAITYKRLNEKSNQLARMLKTKGASVNTLVGIMVERSVNMIIGVLGILKSGSAYVPIDLEYPEDRINFIIQDSNINLIVTQQQFKDKYAFTCDTIDIEDENLNRESKQNLLEMINREDLAYVIYTSGTTGKPKGVPVKHLNLINAALGWRECYELDKFEVKLLQVASISFDVFVGDLSRALINGGEMIICTTNVKSDFNLLHSLILENDISIFESTPSLVGAFMDFIYDNGLEVPSLKILIMGSDICPIKEYKKILNRFGENIRILNSYGVTEATIDSSYYEEKFEKIPAIKNTPIGKPMPNVKFYILDKNRNVQPIGIPGELYIGGLGVAHGYLNREDLTKQKFIEDITDKRYRMYKTGDLAKWLYDGNVEFLGRIDNQVKIRGYRIELGEIENVLLEEASLAKVVVTDRQGVSGETYLCAYVVSKEIVDAELIKEKLKKKIPQYMVPQYIVQLEKLPITFNGKIDIKALPFEEPNKVSQQYVAPTNEIERRLCDILKDLFKIDRISMSDNFFNLGGNSLRAILLITKIHKEFNIKISINDLFENPYIKNIAKNIANLDENKHLSIKQSKEKEYYAASSSQKRIYSLVQLELQSTNYNIPIIMTLEGKVNLEKIQNSFRMLIERHESLRTTFDFVNDDVIQKVHQHIDFNVEYREVSHNELNFKLLQEEFIKPFNLNKGSLIRAQIVKVSEEKYILLVDVHHIIADGKSIEILMSEFVKLYEGIELIPLSIQYKDFSEWQNECALNGRFNEEEQYWMDMYKGEIPRLNMPLDFLRPNIQSFEGDIVTFELGQELTGKLTDMITERNVTKFMVLFASYAALIANYTCDEDLVIGVPIVGRNHNDLENVIGMFVNTLAIRVRPEGNKTFKKFLFEIKDILIRSYENQDFEFEKLIEKLNFVREAGRNPLFDVAFNFRTENEGNLSISDVNIEVKQSQNKVSKFDFTLNAFETKDNIYFELEYCTKLFNKDTVGKIAEYYIKIVNTITENIDISLNEIDIESFENESFEMEELEFNF